MQSIHIVNGSPSVASGPMFLRRSIATIDIAYGLLCARRLFYADPGMKGDMA